MIKKIREVNEMENGKKIENVKKKTTKVGLLKRLINL